MDLPPLTRAFVLHFGEMGSRWGINRTVGQIYVAPDDIWDIVRTLVEERRKREIEPTLTMLRAALLDTPQSPGERHAQARMREMHDLIDMLTGWYQDMQKMETDRLVQLLKLGSKIYRLYELKDRIKLLPGGKKQAGEE